MPWAPYRMFVLPFAADPDFVTLQRGEGYPNITINDGETLYLRFTTFDGGDYEAPAGTLTLNMIEVCECEALGEVFVDTGAAPAPANGEPVAAGVPPGRYIPRMVSFAGPPAGADEAVLAYKLVK